MDSHIESGSTLVGGIVTIRIWVATSLGQIHTDCVCMHICMYIYNHIHTHRYTGMNKRQLYICVCIYIDIQYACVTGNMVLFGFCWLDSPTMIAIQLYNHISTPE